MLAVQVHDDVDRDLRVEIDRLLASSEAAAGRQALSDQLAADLARGHGFVAVTARDGSLAGYAQASAGNDARALELVVDPDHVAPVSVAGRLLDEALDAIADRGGGRVNWFVVEPSAELRALAADRGLVSTRRLLQMRRPLPTGLPVTVETRGFVPEADDRGVLDVNNRAFAGHDEQGGWTVETFRERRAEGWFDPDGLRIHERDGRIAAFCWTKVHPATADDPALGEIYVVAVDPVLHGQGLGRQMTLAGLEHLAASGVGTGMLWVDAGNTVAVGLYEHLGFEVFETNVVFSTEVPAR